MNLSDSMQTIKVAGGIDTILPHHGMQQRLVLDDYGITMMMIKYSVQCDEKDQLKDIQKNALMMQLDANTLHIA